jgi:outer membrane protein OmpA-like peptidoglycan-associated protein
MLRNNASARNRLAMVGTLMVILLGSFGCAGQNWVIDTIREMDKGLVARVARTEATAVAEKTRVDQQLTEVRGIGTDARNRADEAGRAAQVAAQKADAATQKADVATQKADVATQKADVATQKADAVDGRLTRAMATRLKRTQVQQVDVTFKTGKSVLNPNGREALMGILKVLADNPTYTVDVVGYTDSVGKADSNVILSWRRGEAVRRFMVDGGVELNRFSFIGVGDERSGSDAKDALQREKNRRVTITVFKPDDN